MSNKKSFAAAPKPKTLTDDEIAAFEQSGPGHDRVATAAAHAQPTSPTHLTEEITAEPMKRRLSLDLPESLHTRFKTACSATRRKMVSELLTFIERRTSELEAEAGFNQK